MAPSRFHLEKSVLQDAFRERLRDHLYSDMSIRTGDGFEIPGHRLLFGAASPVLREALTDPGSDAGMVLVLPDFTMKALITVLPLLYGGHPNLEFQPEPDPELLRCLFIGQAKPTPTKASKARNKPFYLTNPPINEGLRRGEKERIERERIFREHDDYFDDDDRYDLVGHYDESMEMEDRTESTPKQRPERSLKNLPEEIWECINCGEVMPKPVYFQDHYEKCSMTVWINDSVRRFMDHRTKGRKRRYMEEEDGWRCTECETLFPEKHMFRKHSEVCHSKKPKPLIKCGHCETEFDDFGSLKTHLEDSTECSKNDTDVQTLICDECPTVLYNQRSYAAHQLKHQSKYDCNSCSKSFTEFRNYQKHLSLKHGENSEAKFNCTLCPKSFNFEKNLANHIKVHNKPPRTKFACKKCDQVFSNKSTLHYHNQKHKTPTHHCTICPRTFKSAKGLRYHMSVHNGVADFLCHDCGRGFVTRQKLGNHRRSKHTFEKPYICDQCGQGFFRSDKLVVHKRRAHTGEKPYQCEMCEWRGVDSSSLIHHRKKHSNETNRRATERAHDVMANKELMQSGSDMLLHSLF